MSLFQNTVIKKQIIVNADKISGAYKLYADYFHNLQQKNLLERQNGERNGFWVLKEY